MQDRVAVGDVDDVLVLGDFGDEVAWVEVVADGHSEAEDEDVFIARQYLKTHYYIQVFAIPLSFLFDL